MKSLKLLVIDRGYAQILRMLAEEDEFPIEPRTAETVERALELLHDEEFRIVLLDLTLQGGGFELCRRIRKLYYDKPLQIVLVSPNIEDRSLRRTLEVGADDFISKPFTPLELRMRLEAAMIRLKSQLSLIQEREFYKQAVRQEEDLSAQVLDQNMLLRRAYRSIEAMKRRLEDSNRELTKVARFDPLSGLVNRMSLLESIDVEIDRSVRSGTPLSGLLIDIDRFKELNDNYGRSCGDEVIKSLGERLKGRLRRYDIAGRYGGEEFFVVLPNTPLTAAALIAERFLGELRELKIQCESGFVPLSASVGVTQFKDGEARENWITRTDHALYTAKQRGRGLVVAE